MNSEPQLAAASVPFRLRGIRAFAYVSTLLVLFVPMLMEAFGVHFLPSEEWAERTRIWSLPLYLLTTTALGGVIFYIVRKSAKTQTAWEKTMLVLGCLLFGLAGPSLANFWPPLIRAAVSGSTVTLLYTVDGTSSRKRCPAGLQLRDLPLLHDSLCRVGWERRKDFPKGTVVAVTGYGTAWGLFPASFEKAESSM